MYEMIMTIVNLIGNFVGNNLWYWLGLIVLILIFLHFEILKEEYKRVGDKTTYHYVLHIPPVIFKISFGVLFLMLLISVVINLWKGP